MGRQEDGVAAAAYEEAREDDEASREEFDAAKMGKVRWPLKRTLTTGRQKYMVSLVDPFHPRLPKTSIVFIPGLLHNVEKLKRPG